MCHCVMFICVICHSHRSCGPLNLHLKLTSSLQEGGIVSKIVKKRFTLFFFKIIPVPSFVFSENMACQFVVLVACTCSQNTIHLFIVLVLTFPISNPNKFSLHFTNNIVPELTQHLRLERRTST